ncbi:MAG: hypothetical protein KJO05_06255 [Bacteroidia bacterium]|nr:hypothetical protein [Bacteroidia bacterium]NNF29754.1 hypothetical protein [Flavobacteriaceae bacterium]MBT8274704.1 hypothetical protein [Bacteroidia bacterium]NNJ81339.1 hypothetical protein [Flavobacteriaceae bacterium]NNK55371.1 hypothetical protein [Flavobacteriaceae bacterium]
MKKTILFACAFLVASFAVNAQEDSDVLAANSSKKAVVQKAASSTSPTMDEKSGVSQDQPANDMKKVLAEREAKGAKIRAAKKAEAKARQEQAASGKKKVVTQEMLRAEEIEKAKKATKKDGN